MSIIHTDVDQIIFNHLTVPELLTLSEVSTYYYGLIRTYAQTFRKVRDNFILACESGNLHLAQYVAAEWDRAFLIKQLRDKGICVCKKCGFHNKVAPSTLFDFPDYYRSTDLDTPELTEYVREMTACNKMADNYNWLHNVYRKGVGTIGQNKQNDVTNWNKNDLTIATFLSKPTFSIGTQSDYANKNRGTSNPVTNSPSGDFYYKGQPMRGCWGSTGERGPTGPAEPTFSTEAYVTHFFRAYADLPFFTACINGHLDIAQWIWRTVRSHNQQIDVTAAQYYLLARVCAREKWDVARWLLTLDGMDIKTIIKQIRAHWYHNIFDIGCIKTLEFLSVPLDYEKILLKMFEIGPIDSHMDQCNYVFDYIATKCEELGIVLDQSRFDKVMINLIFNQNT